jgi:hypothetical protein
VNWRAAGCGTLAVVAFVGIGLLGISRAFAPAECPNGLPYEPGPYERVGEPTDDPRLEGVDEPLERAGRTSFGLAGWDVWTEPGRGPTASGEPLPQRIVLDCRDGTFQAYQRPAE